jgi:hypothetical protein
LVDLAEIQAAYYMVAATGVLVAAVYYVMTIRTTQRNLKENLETRQTQLYMQIYQQMSDEKFGKIYIDFMNTTWKDYDDFEKKYGSDEHPENYAKRWNLWYTCDGVGYILRRGRIDVETVTNLGGGVFVFIWEKSKDVIIEQRKRYGLPALLDNFEYLAGEVKRWSNEQGGSIEVPITYLKYIPDK